MPPVRASLFRHASQPFGKAALVFDAVDEVAKIYHSAIDQIVVRARVVFDGRVVFAIRSSEDRSWDLERPTTKARRHQRTGLRVSRRQLVAATTAVPSLDRIRAIDIGIQPRPFDRNTSQPCRVLRLLLRVVRKL